MKKPRTRGNGRMPLLSNTEKIIKEFQEKHGDRYDYSLVEYNGSDCDVIIICPTHGQFSQRADQHKKGNNCPKCAKRYKPNNSEFIQSCQEKFGDRFCYDKTNYTNSRTEIKVICKMHGEFFVVADAHKRQTNGGCPKCGKTVRLTQQDFIKMAQDKHQGKYFYSKTKFENTRGKVIITCPHHGDFLQIADAHLRGRACPKCGNDKAQKVMSMGIGDFIKNANQIHNGKYDYSKTKYINGYTKVEIICPVHGSFWQRPHNHLQTKGCHRCGEDSKFNFKKSKYIEHCKNVNNGLSNIYIIKCFNEQETFFKIGITIHSIEKRFCNDMPYKYEILHFKTGQVDKVWDLERSLHKMLKSNRYKPAIRFGGATECFDNIFNAIEFINKVLDEQERPTEPIF